MFSLKIFRKIPFDPKVIKIDFKCHLKHKENNRSIKQEEFQPNLT